MVKATVVVPTYNEKENIARLIDEILKLDLGLHILVVDDNSPDGTGKIVDEIASQRKEVSVLHREKKEGLGRAYIAGFKRAMEDGADLIIEMDADFSHDPKYLPDILEAAKRADVVLASRYYKGIRVYGWPFRRLLLSKFANFYASIVTVMPFEDLTCGFRCYRREVLEAIDLDQVKSNGYAFQIEMTQRSFKKGFRIVEIPITFYERTEGSTKISRGIVWEALWIVFKLRASPSDVARWAIDFFRIRTGRRPRFRPSHKNWL